MKPYRYFRLDIPASILLILLVIITEFRLEITDWTPDLLIVTWPGVLGTILGLALGYSTFEKTAQRLLSISYSITVLPFLLSGIISGDITELGKISSLFGRFSASFVLLISGSRVEDHIFFVIIVSALFWLIGIYCGHSLIRNREISKLILPTFIPLLLIQYYDGIKTGRIWGMAVYLFFALILAGRLKFLESHDRWDNEHILAGEEQEFEINKYIVQISAILVLISFLIPLPSVLIPAAANTWKRLNDPITSAQTRFENFFAALKSERITEIKGDLFGEILGMGRYAGKGEKELFKIIASQANLPRQYWRMRVYDTYSNSEWKLKKGVIAEFNPDQGIFSKSGTLELPESEFSIYWHTKPSSTLVTPQQTIWISRFSAIQIDGKPGSITDPFIWTTTPVLQDGDMYSVRSLIINPTQSMLRNSEAVYPEWIIKRYLQIPENIKKNFQPLADQITFGLENNFDKTQAITSYLRKNMKYSDVISDPANGKDPIEWFVMTSRSGFCNYYASADVLLLRSIGIPARLVVGFSQGVIENDREYIVRGKDTHAWPEVFFPSIGWVQFEPTTIQPEIIRPAGFEPSQFNNAFGNANKEPVIDKNKVGEDEMDAVRATDPFMVFLNLLWIKWNWFFLLCIFIIFSMLIYRKYLKERDERYLLCRIPKIIKIFFVKLHLSSPDWLEHWIKWEQVTSAERAFHSINQVLIWMKRAQSSNVTPAERARLIKELLPEAEQEIDILYKSLESVLFSNEKVDIKLAQRAGRSLKAKTIKKIIVERFFGV